MSETDRIAKQLERAFSGPAWHGPAVEEVLAGVTAETASRTSPGGIHSIWEIVDHMWFWSDVVRDWIEGGRERPPDEASWSEVRDPSAAAWQATLERLREGQRALVDRVRSLDEARLEDRLFDDMPKLFVVLHGVAHHHLYHAGQIAVLKKIAANS